MKKITKTSMAILGLFFATIVCSSNLLCGAPVRTLVSVDGRVQGTLSSETQDLLKDAEGYFLKAKFYEANSDGEKADMYFKEGVIALSKAEESNPGIGEKLMKKLSEGSDPVRCCPGKTTLDQNLVERNSKPVFKYRRVTRTTRSSSNNSNTRSGESTRADDKADKARRELDENYDRAKKGSSVLQWSLKILNKIPIVKKFIPGGADQTAEAAAKVGDKITAPKDGHAMINGELKVWNEKKGKWEDF